jgi:hypothetical protein
VRGVSKVVVSREIEVEGVTRRTVFDVGVRRSYIRDSATVGGLVVPIRRPRRVSRNGRRLSIDETCVVRGWIEGHAFEILADVVDDLGTDEVGREIDVLLGAITMRQWGIKLDPRNEYLDLTHFADHFVEF